MRVKKSWDLVGAVSFSLLLILVIYLSPDSVWRKVLGLPFILFFPGYSLLSSLFPEERVLDGVERVALSFGVSLAIAPLLGLVLNYTPVGVRLTPIILILAVFNLTFSLFAMHRRSGARAPFYPVIGLKIGWEQRNRLDKALTVILLLLLLSSVSALIYIIVAPKQGEKFTEFYLLGPKGKAADYPTSLKAGENATVIMGIVNHEYRRVNYIGEIWLVKASYYNNTIVVHHMYFMDRFNAGLNHTEVSTGDYTPQWEMPYSFSIDEPGGYKLWFLLFKDSAPPMPSQPNKMKDYGGTEAENRILGAAEGKILSLNLNVSVSKRRPIFQ